MVDRALWRSEALRASRRVQGRSQDTTLSASDLHNARSTILNPFNNTLLKMNKGMRPFE